MSLLQGLEPGGGAYTSQGRPAGETRVPRAVLPPARVSRPTWGCWECVWQSLNWTLFSSRAILEGKGKQVGKTQASLGRLGVRQLKRHLRDKQEARQAGTRVTEPGPPLDLEGRAAFRDSHATSLSLNQPRPLFKSSVSPGTWDRSPKLSEPQFPGTAET